MKLLTKGELCKILGLSSAKSGRLYYDQLSKQYFTDEALKKFKISREKYRRMKVFNAVQTQEIMQFFRIVDADRLV